MNSHIQVADAAQGDRMLSTTLLAFCTDPFVRWAVPDPHQYLTGYGAVFKVFIQAALQHQTAYCAPGFAGVAIWLPPEAHLDEGSLLKAIEDLGPSPLLDSLGELFERFSEFHPDTPHWYMPLMGVEPSHQRQGIGAAMLKHALQVCDQSKALAYLEASSEQNLALYERHGFEVMGSIKVGSSPTLYPMIREPRK